MNLKVTHFLVIFNEINLLKFFKMFFKDILFFEINGKPIGDGRPMTHNVNIFLFFQLLVLLIKFKHFFYLKLDISELALDQAGMANERKLSFLTLCIFTQSC